MLAGRGPAVQSGPIRVVRLRVDAGATLVAPAMFAQRTASVDRPVVRRLQPAAAPLDPPKSAYESEY